MPVKLSPQTSFPSGHVHMQKYPGLSRTCPGTSHGEMHIPPNEPSIQPPKGGSPVFGSHHVPWHHNPNAIELLKTSVCPGVIVSSVTLPLVSMYTAWLKPSGT